MTAIDRIPTSPQHVLPGTEKANDATMARLAAAKALRPRIQQAACDIGLFSDDARQLDICDWLDDRGAASLSVTRGRWNLFGTFFRGPRELFGAGFVIIK